MKLLILNGPNLNRLGLREPGIYGSETMEHCLEALRQRYPEDEILYTQSNVEGFLIDRLQQAIDEGVEGVVFNAGAYTHQHRPAGLHPFARFPGYRSSSLQRTPARRVPSPLHDCSGL